MGEKIIVGPVNRGLKTDRTPFIIDNDSFPTLINAYQWRGRVKRKRGTSLLTRLTRFFNNTPPYTNLSTINLVAGAANILTGFGLQANGNLVPGFVVIADTATLNVYTDPGMDGILVGAPGGSGTVNYATGEITIAGGGANAIAITILYTPDLPVMGLRDFNIDASQFPQTLAFDTVYSYSISTAFPYPSHDVSFYKNDAGPAQKTNPTPTSWNGQDYQQFWTVNYQGALWATNGINVPFSPTNIGMQFKPIANIPAILAGPPGVANLNIIGHGLVEGDFLFINEVVGITGINFQTGFIPVGGILGPNNVNVVFPNATLGGAYVSGGIAQYLTNRSDTTIDCIRWYDGDPTDGNPTNPTFVPGKGWVNFCPPLSQSNFSIADTPPAQYYLVGARMIIPFKDRLLFLGPVIQTSAANAIPIYLQDTVIYSQNGTPYYTCSFTGDPSLATTVFNEILVPINQTATANAYWEDQSGFGGFITAGINQPLISVDSNEDVLIVGFSSTEARLVYSGNDIVPFNFFLINSELGTASTFSSITMDKGVISRGQRGYIITSQVESRRIDLDIPDQFSQVDLLQNGNERFCSQRDYINEWIYFTYVNNTIDTIPYKFPNQTLQFNYRDNSWSIFNESYTTYGTFYKQSGFTWNTVGFVYPSWNVWNVPWNAGQSTLLQPDVIAGNQQGFVLVRDDGTGEESSLYIKSITNSTINSPDHCLNDGDYIIITDALGTVSSEVNDKIFSVSKTTTNTFVLNPTITAGLTYVGGGLITRMYVPFVQTKQFPVSWDFARKTRIGAQQYLLSRTDNAQITLLIYLSQDSSNPYNDGPIVPDLNSDNDSLIYSTVLFTCPESTNLGLTPANTNLQMPTAKTQNQIWHRVNTSLIGDTVQLGFTMSDSQMRTVDENGKPISQFAEIELHAFIIDCNPSSILA